MTSTAPTTCFSTIGSSPPSRRNRPSLGAPSGSETLKKTYTDFVSGNDPLPNRAYQPISADDRRRRGATGGADKLVQRACQPGGLLEDHRLPPRGGGHVQCQLHLGGRLARAARPRARAEDPVSPPPERQLSDRASRITPSRGLPWPATPKPRQRRLRPSSGQFSACAEFAGYRMLDAAVARPPGRGNRQASPPARPVPLARRIREPPAFLRRSGPGRHHPGRPQRAGKRRRRSIPTP